MKMVWSILLALLLSGGPGLVRAQQVQLSLLASAERIDVDSVVLIVLHVGAVEHLHAYSADISYDTALVHFQSLQRLPFFSGNTFFANLVDSLGGKVVVNEAILGPTGQSGEGGLALLRFVGVREGAASFQITASALRDTVNGVIPAINAGTLVTVGHPDGIRGESRGVREPVLHVTNYPNPFNDATMIVYTLPTPSDVRIDLVNVLGQRIRSYRAEGADAGEHVLRWDGKDDQGQPVSSGPLFARVEAGAASITMKLLLLR